MNEDKKNQKRKEIIGVCLDCFVERGLTVTTTKDLCMAANLQNGGIYYYFSTKEEIVLACAEEAINRIEKSAFDIVIEDISDIRSMLDRLGTLADKMSPTMRFLVSVCVSHEDKAFSCSACGKIPLLHRQNCGNSWLYERRG